MAAFDYTAVDTAGRNHKGVLEADSARQTRQKLRDRQLTPVSVHEMAHGTARTDSRPGSVGKIRIGLREVSILTRQLATLIQARLPVEQALHSLSRQSDKPMVKNLLAALRTQVLQGQSLASSLAGFPRVFSELFRSSVHAGERSGHLGMVLEHLADYSESAYQARQKILLALLYPAILSTVSLLIMVFLLAFIVPDMVRVFAGAGHALPLLTRGLIAVSSTVQHYGLLLALLAAGGIWFAKRLLVRPDIRLKLDTSMLGWPVAGKLVLQYNAARFASTLGMLQASGVPLVAALDITVSTLANRQLRAAMQTVAKQVSEGVSLSRAMEQSEVLPPVLVTMVASGEASGTLGDMLKRASISQQRDLESSIALLLGLFEPMILLVMGGMVLLLVLAIILPILNLNQLVK